MVETRTRTVTVSSKGRIVIPSVLRKKVGLKPGMKVWVREVGGTIILTPRPEDPEDRLYGTLAGGESLTEALLSIRTECG